MRQLIIIIALTIGCGAQVILKNRVAGSIEVHGNGEVKIVPPLHEQVVFVWPASWIDEKGKLTAKAGHEWLVCPPVTNGTSNCFTLPQSKPLCVVGEAGLSCTGPPLVP